MRSIPAVPRLLLHRLLGAGAALALLAGVVAFPADVRADPQAPRVASLAWIRSHGAEACIGPRALSASVERKLGRDAFAAPLHASLAIEGHIERDGSTGRWRAVITLLGETGEVLGVRELGSAEPDCRALDDELALVIALLIDPGALIQPILPAIASSAPGPSPAPLAAPLPARLVPLVSFLPQPCPQPIAPSAPWRFEGSGGAIGGMGVLPGMAVGVIAKLRVTPPRWPTIELGGAFWLPDRRVIGAVGASFSLGWGSLMVCPLGLGAAGNRAELCVGGLAGSLRAEGVGLESSSPSEQPELDVGTELGYRRRLIGPLTVSLGLALFVPIVRARFYYADSHGQRRDLFQQAPIAGTLEATVGLAAP